MVMNQGNSWLIESAKTVRVPQKKNIIQIEKYSDSGESVIPGQPAFFKRKKGNWDVSMVSNQCHLQQQIHLSKSSILSHWNIQAHLNRGGWFQYVPFLGDVQMLKMIDPQKKWFRGWFRYRNFNVVSASNGGQNLKPSHSAFGTAG